MKKIIFAVAFMFAFAGFASVTHADVVCGAILPNGTVQQCGNGPIVPIPAGWRHLNVGQEDCPTWFFYAGCMTPRPLGAILALYR